MTTAEARPVIDFMLAAGRSLLSQAGKITDIGVKKLFLTEEDLRIERGIESIVKEHYPNSSYFAEEEHDHFEKAASVWVVDPISGTKLFIEGKPHYAIVASHLRGGIVDFAAVYDPSDDRLYTADASGMRINGRPLVTAPAGDKPIIYAVSHTSPYEDYGDELRRELEGEYTLAPSQGSYALNYCLVAEGLFSGVVSLTKDAFPEFAGCFIARKAGLRATNIGGSSIIGPADRAFVCGRAHQHEDLLERAQKTLGLSRL